MRVLGSAFLGALLIGAAFTLGQLHQANLTASPTVGEAPAPRPIAEKIYYLPDNEQVPTAIYLGSKQTGDIEDWGHKNIGLADAWKRTKGKGVTVAVLDTGCDFEHRDLKAQIIGSKDFTGSRSGANDMNGHGTHCAGVIAAAFNQTGMVGVAPDCKLLIGKVLGDRGSGSSRGIAQGIDWAVDNGADVISMSLGGDSPDSWTQAAVKRARDKGVIVCAAAGNSGPSDGTIGFPGGYPEVICVGATDSNDAVARFSSRGSRLDIAAPGVNVRSCYPGDRFATMSGTSMATPYVAGCAALYVADCKARNVKPSVDDFRKAITASAKDLPPPGQDHASGFGLVQPGKMFPADAAPPTPARNVVIRFTYKPGELTDEEWATLQKLLAKVGTVQFEFSK